ncbi:extracellular solute-binding protein [Paenibacillus sp. J5C_2022]|uniref:extracellular solute-binding protein n=1 Tax=Paenibacillus sp. J5C2022 TaxID=2977129 RepID=UPI0021D2415F|nr:extracellular solute-binding protein [Paenibacillus sp. J5C2022]MCU6710929.1 extracellular solute-binding protein [Paenibacillus sp. J5C2022]
MLNGRRLIVAALSLLLCGLPFYISAQTEEEKQFSHNDMVRLEGRENAYRARITNAYAAGATDVPSDTPIIRLNGNAFSAVSHGDMAEQNERGTSIIWNEVDGWMEWEFEVEKSGFYNIGFLYAAVDQKMNDILRGVQIDGSYPFEEAERLPLKRQFKHSQYPFEKDSHGNDRRPQSVSVLESIDARLTDYEASSEPLRFYLTEGKRTIRLLHVREAVKIEQVYIAPPETAVSYKEAKPDRPAESKHEAGWYQIVEAEQVYRKSNTAISLQSIDAPLVSPQTEGRNIYNVIGGEMFRKAGEWIEWEVEVPKDGYYTLGFKYLQAYLNNSFSYRTITVDGKLLFDEMKEVAFPYNTSWQWDTKSLTDHENNELLIPLNQGKHIIRMTVNASPIVPVYSGIVSNLQKIGDLEQQIRRVTGNFGYEAGNLDTNRDWQLEKYIPDLTDRMTDISEQLRELASYMATVTSGKSDTENAFLSGADDIERLLGKPRKIASSLPIFRSVQNNLSNWAFRLLDQPLMLDYIWVAEPEAVLPKSKPDFWGSIGSFAKSFYQTFTIDYDFRRKDPNALHVWVNRGRDYVNLIQQMADESFTRDTGIPVNVNIVPDPQLFILGNLSDSFPDVALGVDQAMPVDFAIRGALEDLSQFSDYEEVAAQFLPNALRVFHYDGKEYALPEVQGFQIMMYRTDIFHQLGISAPETWSDLKSLLPTLQQNGYDMFVPPKDYQMFIYQNGGELYGDNGMESVLNSEEALRGFEQWVEMFTLYQLPKEVPSFYSHFRLGTLPIGIVDFNTYLQVLYAAPELAKKWEIKLIPGVADEHGEIQRWSGGAMQAGVIYNKTQRKEDAWRFLKWWVSADVQERFGNELEASLGPEALWNTANQDALPNLSWSSDHLEVVLDQLAWFREAPQVPGGYFTARQMDFAWNKVITQNVNAREALEQAYTEINREMTRKQHEFSLRGNNGEMIHPLSIPSLQKPAWRDEE